MEDRRIPLLGVMGAFVFAAQMINFPVGLGTSGHLVGGALLAIVLGPAAAAVVMTAILAMQAFVFQDGGIMALGANVFNMAMVGVLAGYLPYRMWGRAGGAPRRSSSGGVLSVLVSACLALARTADLRRADAAATCCGSRWALFLVSALDGRRDHRRGGARDRAAESGLGRATAAGAGSRRDSAWSRSPRVAGGGRRHSGRVDCAGRHPEAGASSASRAPPGCMRRLADYRVHGSAVAVAAQGARRAGRDRC